MIKPAAKDGDGFATEPEVSVPNRPGTTPESESEDMPDGTHLIHTPACGDERRERFRKAVEQIGKRYGKTFQELA
ncbi:MAG: hypothetical protein IKQ16_02440 [Lentisphaeria bacterium]|nr:hypothetical protein [Lentisphaeria bacterium]